MNSENILNRKATVNDVPLIHKLYVAVSKTKGGLARTEDEVTEAYVKSFVQKSAQNGVQYVAVDELRNNQVIAEMHCYKLEPKVFEHVLSELTIVVDPEYQGQGVGKKLFQTLLNHVKENREDICRVELIARESNIKAIQLYKSLGFEVEGRLQGRIKNDENHLEADIPMAWFSPGFKS